MERIEFKRSRAKNALLLLLSLAFVLGGVFMARTAESSSDAAVGWICAAFFGLTSLAGVRNIVRGGVVFVFDQAGITDTSRGILIPWSEVEDVLVVSVKGTRMLGISLRHPEQFLSRVSAAQQAMANLNQRMGWGHWGFSFTGITPGIDEALRYVSEHVPNVGLPAA